MDKNDFDLDYEFDFEKEYGFDPKEFMSSDDDFSLDDFLDEDDGQSADEIDVTLDDDDEDLPPEYSDEETAEGYADAPVDGYDPEPSGEPEEEYDADAEPEDEDTLREEENSKKKKKKSRGFALPKLPAKKKRVHEDPLNPEEPAEPAKKGTIAKLVEMYMEPVTRAANEEPVLDPTDPKYVARKRREKKRIFKEVYLPAIIVCVALFLILSFITGSVANAITVKRNQDNAAKVEAQQQANAAGIAEQEFKRLIAEAEALAVGYDYDSAISLLESYSGGNDKFQQQVTAKKAELMNQQAQLAEWKDVSTIPNLSFHVLMADASRACNKDVSGADLAGLYNKNFVSVEEFSRILNQLYSANYVLVDFDSFISSNTGVDGNESYFTNSLYLPAGKKPIMITETMVNYFEYMVDPDKDGTPDAKGHGFANKLVVDSNGDIKAAYVDANGQNLVGNYDLVPVLEAFIQEHPDFSYKGARAILAVTGSEGVFGYRTNTTYVSRFGQSFYDSEVAEAKKVVQALRDKGYTIASYTYSNQAYRTMTTLQIQAEIQNWTTQITPVLGEVDTIVFARGSDIDSYSGTTFNVLYNSGLRFFLNSGSSPRVDANSTFIRQTRLMVTGESMAWYQSQFSDYFDCNVVMDLASRGGTPAKS